jgi:tetraacyldisaccharide 4'-kinase
MTRPGFAARLERSWWQGGAPGHWLRPVAALHAGLLALRRAWYEGPGRPEALDVPVLVVGNRIVGGAGKTPVTIALVEALRARGWHPGVVSRGYGRRGADRVRAVQADDDARDSGDEPLLIHRRTGVPVWVARRRAEGARALRAAHPEVDLIVCDDGLQHLALARDAELVVFDERGAGNGRLLPAGPLREPLAVPGSAPCWVLYNAVAPSTPLPGALAARGLGEALPLADWWAGRTAGARPVAALAADAGPDGLHALAGLAHPERFFTALAEAGAPVTGLPQADHAALDPAPWSEGVRTLLVTEKDAVKLEPQRVARQRPATAVWVVPLRLTLPHALLDAVDHALRAAQDRRR